MTRRRAGLWLRRSCLAIGFGILLAVGFGVGPVDADQFKAWVLAKLPDTPEGIGKDPAGNIYAALFHIGEVVKINMDGTYEHVAWVPSKEESGQGDLIGLDTDKDGNIYVAYKGHSRYDSLYDPHHPACKDATVVKTGVYKIDAKTRSVTPLATKAQGWPFCFPDDVAIDSQGNVYLTDITYAGIWKISPDGKKVDLWSDHPVLNWHPNATFPANGKDVLLPLGVNVVVLDKQGKNIYAGMTGNGTVYRFPINEVGSAGEPVAISKWHSPIDGLELDEDGNIYVSEIVRNEIYVMAPDGSQRRLIAHSGNAPLDNNTSLVYKDGMLCTANLGFNHPKWQDADRTVVCVSGYERPKRAQ